MKKNYTLLIILVGLTVVVGIAYYLGDKGGNLREVYSDFAIADTSAVDKIYISDATGADITLTRGDDGRFWMINDEFKAREDASRLLLKTFARIGVKAPVPAPTQPTVISMIAGTGTRVEIFENGKFSKAYLIGTCTQDHFGTYMVLEHADGSRSAEPLIMHMEGFTGCLRQRFFTNEEEWKYTGIFDYPKLDISKVEMINHEAPENSFAIEYGGGNDLRLQTKFGDRYLPVFDTLAVKDYLLKYKKVHFETFNSHLSPAGEDSLLNTLPAYTLRVTENSGDVKKVDIYWKKPIKAQLDHQGEIMDWDGDRMFGCTDGNDVVLVQRYGFDPLLQGIDQFAPR